MFESTTDEKIPLTCVPESATDEKIPENCVSESITDESGIGIVHPIGSADVTLKLVDLNPIKHNFWVMQEPGNHGIIGLGILMKHQLSILPATAELIEIKSDQAAKLLFPNEKASKMVASVNKVAVTNKYSSLEEKCRALIDQFPEITREPHYDENPNLILEIVVENYDAKFIKPKRCWGQRDKIERHFNDLCQRCSRAMQWGHMCFPRNMCEEKRWLFTSLRGLYQAEFLH